MAWSHSLVYCEELRALCPKGHAGLKPTGENPVHADLIKIEVNKNGLKQRNNKGAVLQADKGADIKENRHF